jgi:hypothetical protein
MGDTIRKNAAADDIKSDVEETLANATAKGGVWRSLAEDRLTPSIAVLSRVDADLEVARARLDPIEAALKVMDDEADHLLGEVADELSSSIGRPANDPFFALLFPGGVIFYTDGADEGQPERMFLLAELLKAGVHPKLAPDVALAAAEKVRAKAIDYKAALEAAFGPRSKVKLLEKIRSAVIRAAQTELVKLKRAYLAEGFTEEEIHEVIPDRGA